MPNSLPFPIRVAAGLVASGIETLRTLPQQLPGMGVQLVGAVTKAGLRLQQEVSELAARGDELLESRTEPQEHPAWARFDDEESAQDGNARDAEEAEEQAAEDSGEPAEPPAAPAETATAATEPPAAPAEPAAAPAEPATAADPDPAPVGGPAPAGGLPLDGYDAMTIGQVRGHLRRLSRDEVRALLEHEAGGANRASFLTLLANRITTLDHGAAQ